jgi:gluconate 2-dehydrogenase gamma chain
MNPPVTRRQTLKAIAVAGALQHQHADQSSVAAAAPYRPVFFTAAEYACVVAVAARIIPSDDTPGATEAGVGQYIDEVIKDNPRIQTIYREALAKLNDARFTKLSASQQDAILQKLNDDKDRFWQSIRDRTIDGFYTSRIGLKELGYTGKSFLTEFPGCTHPEHQR